MMSWDLQSCLFLLRPCQKDCNIIQRNFVESASLGDVAQCWMKWTNETVQHVRYNIWTQGFATKMYQEWSRKNPYHFLLLLVYPENHTKPIKSFHFSWPYSVNYYSALSICISREIACSTSSNIVQRGVKTSATCWIKRCWTMSHQHVTSAWPAFQGDWVCSLLPQTASFSFT